MRIGWVKAQSVLTFAVLSSSVGAAIVGSGGTGLTLAGPQVLRLIQQSSAALSTYPALRMSISFEVSGEGQHASGDSTAVMTPDGRFGTASVNVPGRHVAFIVVNGVFYARITPATGSKAWVGFDLSKSYAGSFGMPTGTDAMQYLRMLPGATGPVQVVGHNRVDGVPTTHYRVSIDLAKAYASVPDRLKTTTPDAIAALGVTTMPYDVWLDDAHVIRQLEFRLSTHGVSFVGRVDIRGSRTPVQVTAPPAAKVEWVTNVQQFYAMASGR